MNTDSNTCGTWQQKFAMQGQLFDQDREVIQLHLGGGTPTFFDDEQLGAMMDQLRAAFNLIERDDREYSIEIDPRTVDPDRLGRLAEMGFNRLSLGIQDFDPQVQLAVNRVQDEHDTLELISTARDPRFQFCFRRSHLRAAQAAPGFFHAHHRGGTRGPA